MTSITNGKYASFSEDVRKLINAASHIYVTIASNSEGSTLSNDNNGAPISKRLITSMGYTYPHFDNTTNQEVLGSYKISFVDGTFFNIADEDTNNWYLLESTDPYVYKQLV